MYIYVPKLSAPQGTVQNVASMSPKHVSPQLTTRRDDPVLNLLQDTKPQPCGEQESLCTEC